MLMGLYYSPGIHSPSERFGFVFTPHYVGVMQHPKGVLAVPLSLNHSYEEQYAIVPPGVRWVDLHDELVRTGNPITTIVNHYSADTARAAGRMLAREIDALLEARSRSR
jgi:hypothetical protein